MRPRAKDRCTGDCCREFWLPFSPDELREAYELVKASAGRRQLMLREPDQKSWRTGILEDIELIFPMVVYLGEKRAPLGMNPMDHELVHGDLPFGHYYRCKHLVGDDCTIYDHRPGMCHRYPYGRKCNYVGCTWRGVRAKKETPQQIEKRRRNLTVKPIDLKSKA